MAVTTVTPGTFSLNAANTMTPSGKTAIDPANTIAVATKKNHKLLIMIYSAHANTALTVTAGAFTAAGIGTASIAAANTVSVGFMVDEDRFAQSDGTITGSWHADSAGYIQAWYMPD